jgi:hypothetical protein
MRCWTVLAVAGLMALMPIAAMAGAADRARIYDKLGFAEAAVEACPRLALNPAGVLELMKSLDADDQAALASGLTMIERHKQASAQLFALLGEASCEAALDFERKLGVDIFIES